MLQSEPKKATLLGNTERPPRKSLAKTAQCQKVGARAPNCASKQPIVHVHYAIVTQNDIMVA